VLPRRFGELGPMRSLQVDLEFPEPGSTMSQSDRRFLTLAARAVDLMKFCGTGDGVVRALDGVDIESNGAA
jgi:hypothetical protein